MKTHINSTKIEKIMNFAIEHKVYCKNPKCSGHGVVFYRKETNRLLCPNCHQWIYRDEKTRLKYEMKERGILKCLGK